MSDSDIIPEVPDVPQGKVRSLVAVLHVVLSGLLAAHPLAEAVHPKYAAMLKAALPQEPENGSKDGK